MAGGLSGSRVPGRHRFRSRLGRSLPGIRWPTTGVSGDTASNVRLETGETRMATFVLVPGGRVARQVHLGAYVSDDGDPPAAARTPSPRSCGRSG